MEQGVPAQIVLVGDINKCSDLFAVYKLSAAKLWAVASICMMNSMIGPTCHRCGRHHGTGFTGRLRGDHRYIK